MWLLALLRSESSLAKIFHIAPLKAPVPHCGNWAAAGSRAHLSPVVTLVWLTRCIGRIIGRSTLRLCGLRNHDDETKTIIDMS